jgi:Holliday junction DNA helicase RuvA
VIASLRGQLRRLEEDRCVIDVAGVGYEVVLPAVVRRALGGLNPGDPVELEVYHHVSQHQPVPVLIGFRSPVEREFFMKFLEVDNVGPSKAARALTLSVSTIAEAIEQNDLALLASLPGLGRRSAEKAVATLRGKMAKFALFEDGHLRLPEPEPASDMARDGLTVLLQLGFTRSEAQGKVAAALRRRPDLASLEDLIQEVYVEERAAPDTEASAT